MSDLVTRLRAYVVTGHNPDGPPSIKFHPHIADEAAAEIERLRASGQTLSKRMVAMSDEYEALLEDRDRLRKALGAGICAMEIASALPAVAAEYDFSDALKQAWDAYGHDGARHEQSADPKES